MTSLISGLGHDKCLRFMDIAYLISDRHSRFAARATLGSLCPAYRIFSVRGTILSPIITRHRAKQRENGKIERMV